MAYSIYILSLGIFAFSALQSAFFKHSDLANGISIALGGLSIVLLITAFILKKTCEDDYLAEHFAYQFKAMMVMFLYGLILAAGSVLIASLLGGFDQNALVSLASLVTPFIVLIVIVGIVSFILIIWFLYRNIKGLIYLSLDKDLYPQENG
jgi:uncharacterized membrane protein